MKLIRFGELNKEKPGVVIDDINYDVSAFGEDYDESFFENDGLNRLKKFIDNNKSSLPRDCKRCTLGQPCKKTIQDCMHRIELC